MYLSWRWQDDPQSNSYAGQIDSYTGDGFAINLGQYRYQSEAILADLKQNRWIDEKTRVIFIDFTVYNGNINLFNQMRFF